MKQNLLALAVAVAAFGATNANAYSTYFGQDLNNTSGPLAAIPNSSAAEANFLAQLTGVGTETFEGQTTSATAPLALTFPGAGTATLSGSGTVVAVAPGTDNGFGRYSIPSATSSKYWEVSAGSGGGFTVNFSQNIAAFGFYGIDIGDFSGTLTLGLSNGHTETLSTGSVPNGSVLYFGLLAATGEEFSSVSFTTTAGSGDVFAFDNFTIGTQEQICRENCGTVPEPGSLALAGLAFVGLAASRRRKSA